MAENINLVVQQIIELKKKERSLRTELGKTKLLVDDTENQIEYEEHNKQDSLDELATEYVEEKYEEIELEFEEALEKLKEEIYELESLVATNEVDETEELVKARETLEYLNTAAIIVNKYYEELKKVSTTYFIDLAYVAKSMSLKEFKREFRKLPSKIEDLKELDYEPSQPFRLVNSITEKKNSANFAVYMLATIGSPVILFTTPLAIIRAVKRAKHLHKESQRYHQMMHALANLKSKSSEEITSIFNQLLKLKSQRIKALLEKKNEQLESLNAQIKAKQDAVKFDEADYERKYALKLMGLRSQLEAHKKKVEELEIALEDVINEIASMQSNRLDMLELERMQYLNPRDDREVVIPTQLLFKYGQDSNSMFELKPGLYLYQDIDDVGAFIQMSVFQIRNIMSWGSVQFKVLDLLGAEYVAPLMLKSDGKAKAQDIVISTLKEEREQMIELMHDLLVRRKVQILQTVPNLGDYNLIQKEAGSSPMPYQLIFIVLTDVVKMDEKLIQLIHLGEKLGLLVFIFMKEELLTLQIIKSIETYFKSFIELSSSGLSSYDPEQYRLIVEQRESDRKSHI